MFSHSTKIITTFGFTDSILKRSLTHVGRAQRYNLQHLKQCRENTFEFHEFVGVLFNTKV